MRALNGQQHNREQNYNGNKHDRDNNLTSVRVLELHLNNSNRAGGRYCPLEPLLHYSHNGATTF
uniref:Uncharacterized protein n=1 Tax=Siphoviridae sp. ctnPP24 TaxID=2825662 RepID=A0A8S5TZ84_9CAUD|nr:MAG TPA: hypothetical protein [Siphoviridae sp. ctnPP24]